VDFINRETSVENTDYTENGTLITTTVNPIQAGQLRDYLVEA
jgi:GTP-binding protein HflX